MRATYLALVVLGTVVPYIFFIQYFNAGFGTIDFLKALFANNAVGGISADVFISSFAFWAFVFFEKRVKHAWVFVVLNILIGLSCALPAYLYLRSYSLLGKPRELVA